MIPIITLLVVLYLSLMVTRLATIALVHTGMSQESAKLQARSALSGCGFTTSESENMVNHPVRRRILLILMLFGNIGIVATMSTIILSVLKNKEVYDQLWIKGAILAPGLILLWNMSKSKWFSTLASKIFTFILCRLPGGKIPDHILLCHLDDHHKIAELYISSTSALTGKRVAELKSSDVTLLGIKNPDGSYTNCPGGNTKIVQGSSLIIYGQTGSLEDLAKNKVPADLA